MDTQQQPVSNRSIDVTIFHLQEQGINKNCMQVIENIFDNSTVIIQLDKTDKTRIGKEVQFIDNIFTNIRDTWMNYKKC